MKRTNKELIEFIKFNELIPKDVCEEIIQRLREHDELKKIALDAVDPLIELYNFLIGIDEEFEQKEE